VTQCSVHGQANEIPV